MVEAKAIVVPTMNMIRRPYMSAKDDQKSGPKARPKAGIATVQFTCEALMLYCVWIWGKEGTVVDVI